MMFFNSLSMLNLIQANKHHHAQTPIQTTLTDCLD
jgi:hypothetical protein